MQKGVKKLGRREVIPSHDFECSKKRTGSFLFVTYRRLFDKLQEYLVFDYIMFPWIVIDKRRLPLKYIVHLLLLLIVTVFQRLYYFIQELGDALGRIFIFP